MISLSLLWLLTANGQPSAQPQLVYGTYLGGSDKECATAIAVDASGNAYVAGRTPSHDFPVTSGAFITKSPVNNNDWIGFVGKISPAGDRLSYSTLLGGNYRSSANAVAVDSSGRANVAGSTCSANFPTTPLALLARAAGSHESDTCDGFLVRLNPSGSAIEYGTYLGGSGLDAATALAMAPGGRSVYVGGYTSSPDLPVTSSALQPRLAGTINGFLLSIDTQSGKLLYGTYLGGTGNNRITCIKSLPGGLVYIGGTTNSKDWSKPRLTPFGIGGGMDSFIFRIDLSGKLTPAGIRFGGSGDDALSGIDIDERGDIYAAGTTSSRNFPVTGAVGRRNAGPTSGFIVKIDGRAFGGRQCILWSRLLGGSGEDALLSVSAGMPGSIFVSGRSGSKNFATTPNALYSRLEASNDTTLAQLRASDGRLEFATFVGGTRYDASWYNDEATGVAATPNGDVYVTGCTMGARLPVTRNALQRQPRGNAEPFVLRLKFPKPHAQHLEPSTHHPH